MVLDNIIFNLNVINSIKINDKMIINDQQLSIDKPNKYRSIYRFINNQNRMSLYIFILKLVEDSMIEINRFNLYKEGNLKVNDIKIKNYQQYAQIYWKIIDLKNTLNILKETYKSDIEYTKKLDFIIKKISLNI